MTLPQLATCTLIAVIAALLLLYGRWRAPLGADEGYLWFGVQQLLRGRMPHRDFKSYEPGRYLWSGMVARLCGHGLLPLRIGTHLFFAIGLAFALVVLRSYGLSWPILAATALALAALAHPQHKQFEHAWILAAWAGNALLLLQPEPASLALAAAVTGLSLLFGFNLLLYFGAALAITVSLSMLHGSLTLESRDIALLAAAGFGGTMPLMLLLLLSPGFRQRFLQRRVGAVLTRGQSNLPLPLPWPWRAPPRQLHDLKPAHRRAFQWSFLGLFATPVVIGGWVWIAPAAFAGLAPALLAAAVLGLCVGHHAASRADPPHITQAIAPLCLQAMLLAAAFAPAMAWVVAAAALWLTWPLQPRARGRHPAALASIRTDGWNIDATPIQASLLAEATRLCALLPDRAGFYAAPAYPALYALLKRDAPAYDTFALYPVDAQAQTSLIATLQHANVRAAIIDDAPTDGREELRFSRTHGAVWAHLHAAFIARNRPDLGPDVHVFIHGSVMRADAGPSG
jgi:hypothetical protein